jgi:RNA polymerase sigma-70 factor (ECF subfamily)
MDFQNNTFLIKQLIKGSEEGYCFVVKTYQNKLFAYALSLTNDHALSQDIVQEVFYRTWRFRKKLNIDYSIKAFLYRSIYNEFVNQYHRNQKMMPLEKIKIELIQEFIEESNSQFLEERIVLMKKEIDKLPPKCKKIFLLSKKEGLTNIEIAEHLNLSIKTIEGQMTKAFSKIRKKMGHKMEVILSLSFTINFLKKT